MNPAFYIGATGLRAQERALGVTANNIANMNTSGFKRSEIRFAELVAPPQDTAYLGAASASGLGGVASADPTRVFAQGDLRRTDNALDLAINGEGFIELLGPGGEPLLWRGGSLTVGTDGLLASADGLALRSMITIPEGATDPRIGSDGVVAATLAGDTAQTELGRIDLVRVQNAEDLTPLGDSLYRLSDASGATSFVPGEEGAGLLVQGAVEGSNVVLSNEMVTLLLMQRAYAASAQVIQVGDQLMSIANGLRR